MWLLEGEGAAVAVDYAQEAITTFNTAIGSMDFTVFLTMFVTVVTSVIGVKFAMLALRKGYSMLISFIRGL